MKNKELMGALSASEQKRLKEIFNQVDYITMLMCGGVLEPDEERTMAIVQALSEIYYCRIPGHLDLLYRDFPNDDTPNYVYYSVEFFREKIPQVRDAALDLLYLVQDGYFVDTDLEALDKASELLTCIMTQASTFCTRVRPLQAVLRQKAHQECDRFLQGKLRTVMEAIFCNPFSGVVAYMDDGYQVVEFYCDTLDVPGANLSFRMTSDPCDKRGITLHIGTIDRENLMLLSHLTSGETVQTLKLIGKTVRGLRRDEDFYAAVNRTVKAFFAEKAPMIRG